MTERRAAYRVDANQPAIVAALRDIGATVQHLHMVGDGCPDILVGYRGRTYVMEIKATARSPLTPDERAWHENWRGTVYVVTSPEQAIEIVVDDLREMEY
jgi:hypothetical protein